ncbi:MAG: hypothetical protein LBI48_13165 [Burkholderiaceae bacterium]|jgi:hypothetical protein|nr:hypothetical protein [Burkholderiaceae bacterium]
MLLRVIRFLWKFLKWSLLLVIVLAALLVLINWRDEPLSDEARALLAEKPVVVDVPDRENIYIAMAGINAPQGEDIFEAGSKFIETIRNVKKENPSGLKYFFDQHEKRELLWQETKPPFDSKISKETDFLKSARTQKNRLETTLAANKILIERYGSMQDLLLYESPNFPGLPSSLPIRYTRILNIQRHLLARVLLDMEAGNTGAGLAFFKKDLNMWRCVLEGKSSLLDAMIAVRAMTNDIYVLNLLLASPYVSVKKQSREWQELLEPLSQEQYSLFSAMKGEIRDQYRMLSPLRWTTYQEAAALPVCMWFTHDINMSLDCPVWRAWLDQNATVLFLKSTATFNHSIPYYKAQLRLSSLSWQDYLRERDAALKSLTESYKPKIDWIYNPMGKFLTGPNNNSYDGYIGRIHDLDTYSRLVRLQLELRLAKVPTEKIPAFIREQGQACCAPSADFSWDAQTRLLSFKPSYNNFTQNIPASVYVPEMNAPAH